jgi:nucleoside-diphosphate-sugar epimerase
MTPYGAAKRMVETWAFEYRSAYGLPVVVNRPGTVYGPDQEGSTESGWIAWFLEARSRGLKVTINGDGNQWRDLLHVGDYVRLVLTQLDSFKRYDTGEPWDVGGGYRNAVTVNEMVEYLGLEATHGPARYGDARAYVGVNDVPGWTPEVDWRTSETLAR